MKETMHAVSVKIHKDMEGSPTFELSLSSESKRKERQQAFLVGVFHLCIYAGVFYELGRPLVHQWGLAIAYGVASAWLCHKWQVFLNQTSFIHQNIVTRLQEESVEASQIFEYLRPSKRYWLESSLATLVIALIDFRLGWLTLSYGFWGAGTLMVGIVKLEFLYDFAKEFRRKKTQFGHLVSDYALEQKAQQDNLN